MAQLTGSPSPALEHPLTQPVAQLLHLEHTVPILDQAAREGTPAQCHCAAEELAAQLEGLGPQGLGEEMSREIRRWTGYLDGLAHRDGVDAHKLGRLRSLLEQLERRLSTDWSEYIQHLADDPWLTAYLSGPEAETPFRPGPQVWALLGPHEATRRLGRWREGLAPMRAAAEAGLRLMRDSLARRPVACPPEGYPLELPGDLASGLIRVEESHGYIPEVRPEGTGIRLRFREPEGLSPVTQTVQTTLGWFTL